MKRLTFVFACLCISLVSVIGFSDIVFALEESTCPSVNNMIITNNVRKSDTVNIEGLSSGDLVKVYNAASGGTLLGYSKVASYNTDTTVTIPQIGKLSGSIYVSVTSIGKSESTRTKADFLGEAKSEALSLDNIIITNNSGAADTINVVGLSPGDIVKAYNAVTGGKLLGSLMISGYKTEVTLSIAQLGTSSGNVYVSVTSTEMLESDRTKVIYSAEQKSEPISSDNVIVTNNCGKSDTVYVIGLYEGDIVKVYDSSTKGKMLGYSTVARSKYEATITVPRLKSEAGSIYVSVVTANMLESDRTKVEYLAEEKSGPTTAENVIITNNAGKSDSICISGLSTGDIVKVYNLATKGTLLGTATVANYKSEATVSIAQLGSSAGSVYISILTPTKAESERVKCDYLQETKSDAPSTGNTTITNNVGKADKIYITGLSAGDIIKIYDSAKAGTLLGIGSVAAGKAETTISIAQIGTSSGIVYISCTSTNKSESDRTKVDYSSEQKTGNIDSSNVLINNNSGSTDTIYVNGLVPGDIVNVYDSEKNGNILGTSIVPASKTEITISIFQLGQSSGSVYISVISSGKLESGRIKCDYKAENISYISGTVTITNNAGAYDTVEVTGLSPSDVVKVYDSFIGGTLLGSSTVSATQKETSVSIKQLGTSAGLVYISVTSANSLESVRTGYAFSAESASGSIDSNNVIVTNNSGASDTVEVLGLSENDIVKVYDSASVGKTLGTATVSLTQTSVTISISQLGVDGGNIYVSVTSLNKQESCRVKIGFAAETKSVSPSEQNITVENIVATIDTVKVTSLTSGDIVKVYNAEKGGTLLGTGTVQSMETEVCVSVGQLESAGGSVYVTITSTKKLESDRTKYDYSAESKSGVATTVKVTVTNNAGTSDVIKVSGLSDGDLVKVYDAAKSGTLIGSETVPTYSTEISITVDQLGSDGGSIYVSVTNTNKLESDRTKVDFKAEPKSTTVAVDNILVTNNAGTKDTIKVAKISAGDIVKIYDSEDGGNVIGMASVPDNSTETTITINQIGTSAGSIYVSVTSTAKLESDRTKADFIAETDSNSPIAKNITIVNKSGLPGTVTVKGLVGGDIIKVYDMAQGGNLLGSGTVSTYETSATVNVTQLGSDAGSVYVTVTSTGKLESTRTKADFSSKLVSISPLAEDITVSNNAGIQDTIKVTNLDAGDIVKIYNAAEDGTLLAMATVSTGTIQATATMTQLGASGGSIYVSVVSLGKTESLRTKVDFNAEAKTDAPSSGNITVANNVGASDTVEVNGLIDGDVVKVYSLAEGGSTLGTANVLSSDSQATVSISQLGSSSGSIYVTVTSIGKTESIRVKADYIAESSAPNVGNIDIINNAVISDTITVSGLTANDVVKVYDSAQGGYLLGSAKVNSNATQAIVYISQLTQDAGNVYISVTNFGRSESNRTKADYAAETSSNSLFVGNVVIVNNAGISDVITVNGLIANDVIKVYDSEQGGSILGSYTVANNSTQAIISISQLSTSSGSVYLTLTSLGKTESARTKVDFAAEVQSYALFVGNIEVTNNKAASDTITVNGLTSNDLIKVYDSNQSGNMLGSATVPSKGTQANITIAQIGANAGSIYVSVTSLGNTESERTKVYFVAEP